MAPTARSVAKSTTKANFYTKTREQGIRNYFRSTDAMGITILFTQNCHFCYISDVVFSFRGRGWGWGWSGDGVGKSFNKELTFRVLFV